MTYFRVGCLAAALLCAGVANAAAGEGPLQALPEDLEVARALSAAEKAAINAEHKALTDALCEIRELWCLINR
jgi:hypothetical protein